MKTHNADLKPSLIDLEASNMATGGKQELYSVQPERLSERDNIYCVYWLRLCAHVDPFTEGYIGITKNLKERLRAHKKNKRKTHLYNAIHKYGWNNIIVDVLKETLTFEQALLIENQFRSSLNIGWNCQIGGNVGVESDWYNIPTNREKHSKNTSNATKIAIAKKDSKEKRSLRAKKQYIINKNSYKDIVKGSKNPNAILNEEQVYKIKFELLPKGLKHVDIAKMFNVKPHVITQIKSNKTWKHIVCDSPDYK